MPEWRRSAAEWGEIVDAWLASGCSRTEYAKRVGVNATTLGVVEVEARAAGRAPDRAAVDTVFADVVLVPDRVAERCPTS